MLRWLQQHPGWLLIIDNVDTEKAAAAVENILPALRGGHVLITSRLAEWSGSVERLNVDVLSEDAAHAFLLERTARDRRKVADDDFQARTVARELGCLALALEQAGSYINHHRLSFAQYLRQWHANRDKVSSWFDPRVMKYPRSVAVTWQTSLDQLGEPARRLLQRLAWLAPEPIPETLLEVPVLDDGDANVDQSAALAELETYSLVARSRDAATFAIHRLVQDVTRLSLNENRDAVLASVLAWMDPAFKGDAHDLRMRPRLELLAPHVRAVTDHAEAAEVFNWNPWLLIRLGTLLGSRVPLTEVEPLYRRAVARFKRRVRTAPDNADWQRDLSVAFNRVGDVLVAQGKPSEALTFFRQSLAIRERLVETEPKNSDWQRDLSVSYDNVGDVLVGQGNLREALESYRAGLIIAERRAKADASNAESQRDLAILYNKVGHALEADGNLAEALKSVQESVAICERLVKRDSNNTLWQRDLSASYNSIGDVLLAQGNVPEALKSFRDSLAIRKRLAELDANNVTWQRDLSLSSERVGDALALQGNEAEALKSFRSTLAIRERLTEADPENVQWQVDLIWSHWRLASCGDDPAHRWSWIVQRLRTLKDANRLTVEQARWLAEAEKELAKFR